MDIIFPRFGLPNEQKVTTFLQRLTVIYPLKISWLHPIALRGWFEYIQWSTIFYGFMRLIFERRQWQRISFSARKVQIQNTNFGWWSARRSLKCGGILIYVYIFLLLQSNPKWGCNKLLPLIKTIWSLKVYLFLVGKDDEMVETLTMVLL